MKSPAFQLLHTDPRFYLVSKSAGVSFHRTGEAPGLLESMRAALNDDALWPVHRLDRMTSGLLLVARSATVAAQLSDAFASRLVGKVYLALSDRKPNKKQGWVKGDMLKGRGGSWRLQPSTTHPAVTRFETVSLKPGLRLFVLYPMTGRTHQLRVAMKSISAPILGDLRYGGSVAERGYLHAYSLTFSLGSDTFTFVHPPQGGLFDDEVFRLALVQLAPSGQH